MGLTKIEWATHTWNPIVGCSKCSPGCKNCYAERMAKRLASMGSPYYKEVVTEDGWNGKTVWNFTYFAKVKPSRVFVCSMSDIFHESVTDEMIKGVFSIMNGNQHHTYIILTKRPKRMRDFIHTYERIVPSRMWCGVTVCNQKEADEKIPILLEVEANVKFISIEPMLEPIDLECFGETGCPTNWLDELNWVIVGGESGPGARPMYPSWVRSIRNQCLDAGVPFLFKQWGEFGPANGDNMVRMRKKNSGRVLDGKIHDEYPVVQK